VLPAVQPLKRTNLKLPVERRHYQFGCPGFAGWVGPEMGKVLGEMPKTTGAPATQWRSNSVRRPVSQNGNIRDGGWRLS
jgi:hypothetical protein